ncbi:MAG: T9SS type A sorting domain-containing protein, partial [Bacteroidota bacterium]
AIEFAKRGFVAATINYRLGWDQSNKPDQLNAMYRANQDARAALRFIVKNAAKAKVDTDWMFLSGSSAGAITALNTVYTTEAEWEAEVPGITTALGGLDDSGNNINRSFDIKGIFNNWGMVFDAAIGADEMVPTIGFVGALDRTTPIGTGPTIPGGPVFSGAGSIHDILINSGTCSELTVDPEGGHGIYGGASGGAFRISRAACFFKSLFCENCTSNYFVDSVAANCAPQTANRVLLDDLATRNTAEFTAFPNPTNDLLHISGNLENYHFTLMNTSGQIVRNLEYGSVNTSIEVKDLSPGVYFLRAVSNLDNRIEIKKILIQ